MFVVDAKKALQGQGFDDTFTEDLTTLFLELRSNPHLLAKILRKIYFEQTSVFMVMVGNR